MSGGANSDDLSREAFKSLNRLHTAASTLLYSLDGDSPPLHEARRNLAGALVESEASAALLFHRAEGSGRREMLEAFVDFYEERMDTHLREMHASITEFLAAEIKRRTTHTHEAPFTNLDHCFDLSVPLDPEEPGAEDGERAD